METPTTECVKTDNVIKILNSLKSLHNDDLTDFNFIIGDKSKFTKEEALKSSVFMKSAIDSDINRRFSEIAALLFLQMSELNDDDFNEVIKSISILVKNQN